MRKNEAAERLDVERLHEAKYGTKPLGTHDGPCDCRNIADEYARLSAEQPDTPDTET